MRNEFDNGGSRFPSRVITVENIEEGVDLCIYEEMNEFDDGGSHSSS